MKDQKGRNSAAATLALSLGAFAMVCSPAWSLDRLTDTLTLHQAVLEGQERSPEIQKAAASVGEASWKKTEALSGFLPSINISAEHFVQTKFLLFDVPFQGGNAEFPEIFPSSTLNLNLNVPIFDGLQNVYTFSAAGDRKRASEHDRDWTQFRVSERVRLDFLRALAAQKLQNVSRENLKTISDHLNQTTDLKRGGVATNFDVLRVEVQLNEAKSGVLQADDNVFLARRQLAVTMGLNADDRTLEGELPGPEPKAIESLQAPSSVSRPDLLALSDRASAADNAQAASGTYLVPRLSFTGQYQEYNDLNGSLTDSSQYRSAYNVGLMLTWNLFDGMSSISRSREAVYQKIQADKALEQAELQVPYDFDFWKRRYLYSAALYLAKKSDVEKSEESVRLAQIGFKAGTRTSTEVLDAELDLFRARAGVVDAQMNCAEAKINLELALGVLVEPESDKEGSTHEY